MTARKLWLWAAMSTAILIVAFAAGLLSATPVTAVSLATSPWALQPSVLEVNCTEDTYNITDCTNHICPVTCSGVVNITQSVPQCNSAQTSFEVTLTVTECDSGDIGQLQAALYESPGCGYMTGGGLTRGGNGNWTGTFCVSEFPTSIAFSWQGKPPGYWTNGPYTVTVKICCSTCEPEDSCP